MNCEICTFDASADSVLWTCAGCPRKFHAACIGVTVQRNSLRRKDRKAVDVSSYILPCCDSCQEFMQAKIDFKQLAVEQKRLAEQINSNTEVAHRFTLQQEKPSFVQEAIDGLEILLVGIKNELAAINKSSSLAGCVTAIKNHVTSVFDTAILSTNQTISKSVKSMASDMTIQLSNINEDICQLKQQSLDIATSTQMTSNPLMGTEILNELKSWSANIIATNNHSSLPADITPQNTASSLPSAASGSSLETELLNDEATKSKQDDPNSSSMPNHESSELNNVDPIVVSVPNHETSDANASSGDNHESTVGWRKMGRNKVFGDWSENDARNRLHHQQTLQRDDARAVNHKNASQQKKT